MSGIIGTDPIRKSGIIGGDVTFPSDLKLAKAGGGLHLGRASDGAQIHRIYSDSGNNLKIASDLSSGGSISFVPSSGSGTAMTLTSDDGQIGIGTQGYVDGSRLNIFEETLGDRCLMLSKGNSDTSSSQWFVGFRTNDTTANGAILGNGASNVAFSAWSDERLKENIATATGQLDLINKLRPVTFKWKAYDETSIGFIAQEFQKILPENVGDEPPTEEQIKAGETGTLSIVGWAASDARMVSAIQELSAKNDALEARVLALESA